MTDLASIRALTFDCYGTLVDWERGLLDVLRPWADGHGVDADDETLLAAFANAEPACEAASPTAPYRDVLRDVHRVIARRFDAASSCEEAETFARSVGNWPVFDDTPAALARLSERFTLVIVSNVDAASFARTAPKLGVTFDEVVTAETVGAYKPDPRMFRTALAHLASIGVRANEVLHVAQSLYHDHVPAQALELRTAWVTRGRTAGGAVRAPDVEVRPDLVADDMAELAERLLDE